MFKSIIGFFTNIIAQIKFRYELRKKVRQERDEDPYIYK